MRRICIVTPDGWDETSGIYTSVVRIRGFLLQNGWDADVVCLRFDKPFLHHTIEMPRGPLNEYECAVGPQDDRNASNSLAYTRLLDLLRQLRPECIHLFYLGRAGFIAARVASELGIPIIASARGSDVEQGHLDPLGAVSLAQICREARVVTCVTKRMETLLARLYSRTYRVIYNSYAKDHKIRIEHNSVNRKAYLICDVHDPLKKGLSIVLQSLKEAQLPEQWRVRFAGISADELRSWVSSCGCDDLSPLLIADGTLNRGMFVRLLSSASGYIQASTQDGCPNALLEALAVGCPVISSRAGAAPELLQNGVDSLLYNPWDYRELARHITAIACAHVDGESLAVRARYNLAKILSSERESQEWYQVYQDALE